MKITSIQKLYEIFLSSSSISTDSRKISKGNIFFALKGDNFNGNLFALATLDAGAAYAVVDEEVSADNLRYDDRLIEVDDVLSTLQQLALFHRRQLKANVIAITGSNGKTTTKELLAAVLNKKYKTKATEGNLNNHIGIPLTLLSMPSDVEMAVVEMGANHQKEIAAYCEYTLPDFGLITNVGKAHLEGFGSEEGVVKGKTELYAFIAGNHGKVFVSDRSEKLKNKAHEFFTNGSNLIFYGSDASSFVHGRIVSDNEFLKLQLKYNQREFQIKTNLVGDYNFENVMAAVCVGLYFEVPIDDVKDAIENYFPTNNRSQKIQSGTNEIILDAYNANPSSMMEALKSFERIASRNKITIIGEMMELGDESLAEHQRVADFVFQMDLAKRIFVGDGFSFLKGKEGVLYFEHVQNLKEWYAQQKFEHTILLIKGSRKNKLESILNKD